jgi:hypothetical protein
MTDSRRRLSYANIMSTLAVFLCLGGTAVAATKISGSSIKDRSISHTKVIKNTLTGAEVKESSLGTVPKAASAGKVGGVVLLRVNKQINNADSVFHPMGTISGIAKVEAACSASATEVSLRLTNKTGGRSRIAFSGSNNGSTSFGQQVYDAGSDTTISLINTGDDAGYQMHLTILNNGASHVAELFVDGVTSPNGDASCQVAMTALSG